MLSLILLIFAFVCFTLAAFFNAASPQYPRLVAAGLAFWSLSVMLGGVGPGMHK